MKELEEVYILGVVIIKELEEFLKIFLDKFVKILVYEVDGKIVVVVVRGDREVNEIKVFNVIGFVIEFVFVIDDVVRKVINVEVGFVGLIGINVDYVFIDKEIVE